MDVYWVLACETAPEVRVVSGDVEVAVGPLTREGAPIGHLVRVSSGSRGLVPYAIALEGGCLDAPVELQGLLPDFTWHARFFAWTTDPREDPEAWRAEADARAVVKWPHVLDLPFGSGGPSELDLRGPDGAPTLPADRFGTLASATVRVPAGRWRIVTLSDDGIRVRADGELVIDDWTWHAPTRHEAVLELAEPRDVLLEVEHFELDGHAVLSLQIERAE